MSAWPTITTMVMEAVKPLTADETREPDRLRGLIERTAATAMQATPQTWRLLESAGGVPAGLRLRLCGGETLPAELAAKLMAPGVTL